MKQQQKKTIRPLFTSKQALAKLPIDPAARESPHLRRLGRKPPGLMPGQGGAEQKRARDVLKTEQSRQKASSTKAVKKSKT